MSNTTIKILTKIINISLALAWYYFLGAEMTIVLFIALIYSEVENINNK